MFYYVFVFRYTNTKKNEPGFAERCMKFKHPQSRAVCHFLNLRRTPGKHQVFVARFLPQEGQAETSSGRATSAPKGLSGAGADAGDGQDRVDGQFLRKPLGAAKGPALRNVIFPPSLSAPGNLAIIRWGKYMPFREARSRDNQ